MGSNDFWIKGSDNKRQKLNEFKAGIRRDQLDEKLHNLFDIYDKNFSGTLESEEVLELFKNFKKRAGADKTFDLAENSLFSSTFSNIEGLEETDFMGFVKAVSDNSKKIISRNEITQTDGFKIITTKYNDGVTETLILNENNEFILKKTIKERIQKNTTPPQQKPPYELSKLQIYFDSQTNLEKELPAETIYEISKEGKKLLEERNFVMQHYIQSHQATDAADKTMGPLDYIGAGVNTFFGETWELFTKKEYSGYFNQIEKFDANEHEFYKIQKDFNAKILTPEMLFIDFQPKFFELSNHELTSPQAQEFYTAMMEHEQVKTLEYQLQLLKQAKTKLEEAMIESHWTSGLQDMPGDYSKANNNPVEKLAEARKLLIEFFGDEEVAEAMINEQINMTSMGQWDTKSLQNVIEILEMTTNLNLETVKAGRTSEEIQNKYYDKYKEMYNLDYVPEVITDKIYGAKGTAGTTKLLLIMAITALISKSPAMTKLSTALAAGETNFAAGSIMNLVVKRFGVKGAQQLLKFAMTSGTIATDVGIEALNMSFSEAGINGEELGQKALGASKYILFGAYVGSPMAEFVGKHLAKTKLAGNLFRNGVKSETSLNGIKTTKTTISGDQLAKNLQANSNSLIVKGGKLATDITAFAGLDIATEDTNLFEAFGESGKMMLEIKLMHHVLQYFIGGKAHTATIKTNMEKAINQSGVKDWTITEIKSSDKNKPTVCQIEYQGVPLFKCNSPEVGTAIIIGQVYKTYQEIMTGKAKETEQKQTTTKPESETTNTPVETPTNVSTEKPNTPIEQKTTKQKPIEAQTPKTKPLSERPDAELIERYKELQAQSKKDGIVNEELLSLTLELSERGYKFKFGELDVDTKVDVITLSDSNLTKPEIIALLRDYGVKDNCLEIIEYNLERINKELLSTINDLNLLNSPEALPIFMDVKAEDVPAKRAAYKAIKNSNLSPRMTAIILCNTNATNFKEIKGKIKKINEVLKVYKEASPNGKTLKDNFIQDIFELGTEFNKELFDALKESWDLVTQSNICFNQKPEDISAKIETFNKLKTNSEIDWTTQRDILDATTKDNKSKMSSVCDIVKNGYENLPELLSKLNQIDGNLLEALKQDIEVLNSLRVDEITNIKPEDVEAKIEIIKQLQSNQNAYSSMKTRLIVETTKQNQAVMTIINNIAQNPDFKKFDALFALSDVIDLNVLKTLEKDIKILNSINLKAITNLSPETSQAKIDIYNKIKDNSKISSPKKANILQFTTEKNAKTIETLIEINQNPEFKIDGFIENSDKLNPELLNALKDDVELLNSANIEKLSQINAEDIPAKINLLKQLADKNLTLKSKLIILYETTKDNIDVVTKQIELNEKYERISNLKEPQFTEAEELERRQKLKYAFELIDKNKNRKAKDKEDAKKALGNAKNMEEFLAKYEFVVMTNGNIDYYNLTNIKIKEQVEVAKKYNNAYYTYIYTHNFPNDYKYITQFDPTNPLIQGRLVFLPHCIEHVRTPQDFTFLKELLEDPQAQIGIPSKQFIQDEARQAAYRKLKSDPQYTTVDAGLIQPILVELNSGKTIPNITDIASTVKEAQISQIRETIATAKNNYNSAKGTATQEALNSLLANFPNINIEKFSKITPEAIESIQELISNNTNLSLAEVENFLNTTDFTNFPKRKIIIKQVAPEVGLKIAKMNDIEFDKMLTILEKRPEILLQKHSSEIFFKALEMPEAQWQNYKRSTQTQTFSSFDETTYKQKLEERMKQFELNMSTFEEIENRRTLEAQSNVGTDYKAKITVDTHKKPTKQIPHQPQVAELYKQLEETGETTITFEDKGGMNPIQVDNPIIRPEDKARLGIPESAEISINIGQSRQWENERLARDILQNFYDGNGYTLEGVQIQVKDIGNGQYSVKISGKGLYDYNRLLDWGDSSKSDPRSAGYNGEGTKIIAGNILHAKGATNVSYSAGEWNLAFTKGEKNHLGEIEIMQTLTKAKEYQNGTSIEFTTNDKDFALNILKAKDYFYSPYNKDFANTTFENDYFAIKVLPKGEKGNLYLVQRYELEGKSGYSASIDGLTLIFKRQPNDPVLTELNNGSVCDVKTGRNRVALSPAKIKELLSIYTKTMTDSELINLIGNMENLFIIDEKNTSRQDFVLESLIKEAENRKLKIDFGHNKFLATNTYDATEIRDVTRLGKIPVKYSLSNLGIPTATTYRQQNSRERMPLENLTPIQTQKLQLLEEAMNLFSESLNLENADVVSNKEAHAPKYIFRPKGHDNVVATAILSQDRNTYQGHWVTEQYFNTGSFYDLLATWLHETSHKTGGDGSISFNNRLIQLQQLIVDISCYNPSFIPKLKIIADKFNAIAKSENPKFENKATNFNVQQSENTEQTKSSHQKTSSHSTNSTYTYSTPTTTPPKNYGQNSTAQRVENDMQTLKANGKLNISIPKTPKTKPEISTTAIDAKDRVKLGITENTKILLTYGSKHTWSYEVIARDLLQNFFDGHGQTLDGVKIDIQKQANGKYKVKISGLSEYNYYYLKIMNASTKTANADAAGGFGEGAKMASKTMLHEKMTDKITFASGDWTMDFTREEGVDANKAHMQRTLRENTTRVDGTYVEFETANDALVEAVVKAKDYFAHSQNTDFQGLDWENNLFGFKILNPEDKGNLYYTQRFAIKADGKMEGALNGIKIIFKKGVDKNHPAAKTLGNDCDRTGFTTDEIQNIATYMAASVPNAELMKMIAQLERFWIPENPHSLNSNNTYTPETAFALGLIKEAGDKHLNFDLKNSKIVAIDNSLTKDYQIKYLIEKGYKIAVKEAKMLGFPTVSEKFAELNKAERLEATPLELKKIQLIKEILPVLEDVTIEIFEKRGDQTNVYKNENTIAIDRTYLKYVDFNTLYTQITTQLLNTTDAADWGYAITDLLSLQLSLFADPAYKFDFEFNKKKYESLPKE